MSEQPEPSDAKTLADKTLADGMLAEGLRDQPEKTREQERDDLWRTTPVGSEGAAADSGHDRFSTDSPNSRFLEWLIWTLASAAPVFSVAAWITIAVRRRNPRLAYDAAVAALWPLAGFVILLLLAFVFSFVNAILFIQVDQELHEYHIEAKSLTAYNDAYAWTGTALQLGELNHMDFVGKQMKAQGFHYGEWFGRFGGALLLLIWPAMWIASIFHAQRQWFANFDQRQENEPQRDKLLVSNFALWLLFGWIGGHRFYVGRWISGLLYAFSLGGLGIGWAADLIFLRTHVDCKNAKAGEPAPQAPWADEVQFGFFDFFCRWVFFVVSPMLFVWLCVSFSQYELLLILFFTLIVCGLFGNLHRSIERLALLEKAPLARPALVVVRQLYEFYFQQRPRSFWFYAMGPLTSPLALLRSATFREETKLYLRFLATILSAVLINQIRLIPTTYRYHSVSGIATWMVVHAFFAVLLCWVILTPILTTTYTFSLSGRLRRLRVLSISALCVACITGLVSVGATYVNREPTFVSYALIHARLRDDAFQQQLTQSSKLFLEHYVDRIPKPLDEFYEMASHPDLTKRYQEEVLSTLTSPDEAKVFRVFSMDVEGDEPDRAWIGVGTLFAEDQDEGWRTLFMIGPDHQFYSAWDSAMPPRVADDFAAASALWNSQYEHRIARRDAEQDARLYDQVETFLRAHKQQMRSNLALWPVQARMRNSEQNAIEGEHPVFDPNATDHLRRALVNQWGNRVAGFRLFLIPPTDSSGWWLGVTEDKQPLCILSPWDDYFRSWDRHVFARFETVTNQLEVLAKACREPGTDQLVSDLRRHKAQRFLSQYVLVTIDDKELTRRARAYLVDEFDASSADWRVERIKSDDQSWIVLADNSQPLYLLNQDRVFYAREQGAFLNLARQAPPLRLLAKLESAQPPHLAERPDDLKTLK